MKVETDIITSTAASQIIIISLVRGAKKNNYRLRHKLPLASQ